MKKRSSYWLLSPYLRLQRRHISWGFFWVLIYSAFWPVLATLAGQVSRYLGSDLGMLIQIALWGALAYILQGIAQYGQNTSMAKVAVSIGFELRQRLYAHLLRLGPAYFADTQIGDLSYRLTGDIDRVSTTINNMLHQFLPSVLQLVVVLGNLLYLNWRLTIAVFLIAPLIAVLVGWFGEQVQNQSRRSQNQIADLSSAVTEDFTGIRLIQAFAAEEFTLNRFMNKAEANRQAKYQTERWLAIQHPVLSVIQVSGILLVLVLAGWQVNTGNLSMPGLVSYFTSIAMLIDPISRVTSNYSELKQCEASVDRIFELLAVPPTILEKPQAIALPAIAGHIQYQNVTFSYVPDKPVLKNFNLDVKPGEMIALVGTSGAGKSTIASLLMRFYDIQAGSISIDNIDIRDVTLPSLRRQIGTVPQDTVLFSATVAENIAFGQPDFDMAAVEAAAKIANAHQFISQLSQGYQTWVGERGTNFSGGQRQRIAIARAVFLNPRILVLDEATSALDSESEALVQEALERIMIDRTVFIIAHRLATVRKANRILVVENGQVIESGSHSELLKLTNGRYASFHAQQFR
jgi:ATP-binding cassette, subfamily B, bacterial